jgi:hypothetical protein
MTMLKGLTSRALINSYVASTLLLGKDARYAQSVSQQEKATIIYLRVFTQLEKKFFLKGS